MTEGGKGRRESERAILLVRGHDLAEFVPSQLKARLNWALLYFEVVLRLGYLFLCRYFERIFIAGWNGTKITFKETPRYDTHEPWTDAAFSMSSTWLNN